MDSPKIFGDNGFVVRTAAGMAKRLGGGWQLSSGSCGGVFSAKTVRSK